MKSSLESENDGIIQRYEKDLIRFGNSEEQIKQKVDLKIKELKILSERKPIESNKNEYTNFIRDQQYYHFPWAPLCDVLK